MDLDFSSLTAGDCGSDDSGAGFDLASSLAGDTSQIMNFGASANLTADQAAATSAAPTGSSSFFDTAKQSFSSAIDKTKEASASALGKLGVNAQAAQDYSWALPVLVLVVIVGGIILMGRTSRKKSISL